MSSFTIKLIALVSMIIDHTGAVLFPQYRILRLIGRIAFPLYVFLIAQGCRNTRNLGKYAIRLLLFALLSEIPFDLAFYTNNNLLLSPFTWFSSYHQNVYFTLGLGVVSVALYTELTKRNVPYVISLLSVIPCAFLAMLFSTDYSWYGVLGIFICAILKEERWQWALILAMIVALYSASISSLLFASLSILPILLYNKKRGIRIKWLFYWAYPVHLTVLAFLCFFIAKL